MSLVETVRKHVELKESGRVLKGICPFHEEKSPSFVVEHERGLWHCFGCGKGGDEQTFLELIK